MIKKINFKHHLLSKIYTKIIYQFEENGAKNSLFS